MPIIEGCDGHGGTLGTGFRPRDFGAPRRFTGLTERDLDEARRDGQRAYLGMAIAGFPNFVLMYVPNTNVGSGSVVHMLESEISYIVQAARALRDPEVLYSSMPGHRRTRTLDPSNYRIVRR